MYESNLTPEEVAQIRATSYEAEHPLSWVWDEEALSWKPPKPAPADGFPYIWDETCLDWVPFPDYPRT